ncbi:hypothetical protein TNCV_1546721 [Trichonephila clavipes]|nr:hypothetical protein TNCV_1546721 [Trichonephila clavipes]
MGGRKKDNIGTVALLLANDFRKTGFPGNRLIYETAPRKESSQMESPLFCIAQKRHNNGRELFTQTADEVTVCMPVKPTPHTLHPSGVSRLIYKAPSTLPETKRKREFRKI